jgi:hypothetical protein
MILLIFISVGLPKRTKKQDSQTIASSQSPQTDLQRQRCGVLESARLSKKLLNALFPLELFELLTPDASRYPTGWFVSDVQSRTIRSAENANSCQTWSSYQIGHQEAKFLQALSWSFVKKKFSSWLLRRYIKTTLPFIIITTLGKCLKYHIVKFSNLSYLLTIVQWSLRQGVSTFFHSFDHHRQTKLDGSLGSHTRH